MVGLIRLPLRSRISDPYGVQAATVAALEDAAADEIKAPLEARMQQLRSRVNCVLGQKGATRAGSDVSGPFWVNSAAAVNPRCQAR